MLFKDVIGQRALKHQLVEKTRLNKVSQALLFAGSLGYGGLPMALAYSQFLNCENKTDEDSCRVCPSCMKAQKLVHPDIHFTYPFFPHKEKPKILVSSDVISEWRQAVLENPYLSLRDWVSVFDGENKQPNIPMDECHRIIHNLSFKAFESPYKVVIIWLPEYLGKEGNSLLKILEEPAEKTVFLMIAENTDKILPTILSRSQIIRIPPIENESLAQALQKKFEVTSEEAYRCASVSNGDMIEAGKYFKETSSEISGMFVQWFSLCIPQKNPERILSLYNFIEKFASLGREEQKNFLKYALHFLHESIISEMTQRDSAIFKPQEKDLSKIITEQTSVSSLQKIYETVNDAHYHLERNAHTKVLMMQLSIKISGILKQNTLILT